jgi:tRNA pseudouridine32 synthase/23S rRNA pseudouridine746 synthase
MPPTQALSQRRTPACTVHLPRGDWATVLDALCARFPRITRASWVERMDRGAVLDADGHSIGQEHAYRFGMRVHYFREVIAEAAIPFKAAVLYRDEHLVIADKPHFLPVIPAGAYVRETLLTRLIEQLDNPNLVPLHRIDRATAGLVMLSANPRTRAQYQALFREQRIQKCYEALAPELVGLTFPLVRRSRIVSGPEFFRMQEVTGESNSETTVDVIDGTAAFIRYALRPLTGRKHQLRVHLAGLGAPIIGDRLYPVLQPAAPDDYAHPLQLLARSLAFIDPRTGAPRRFESAQQLQVAQGAAQTAQSVVPRAADCRVDSNASSDFSAWSQRESSKVREKFS